MLQSKKPRGRPSRKAAAAAVAANSPVDERPSIPPNIPVIWAPNPQSSGLENAVRGMIDAMRPENTSQAYDGKAEEFVEYCIALYDEGPYRYVIDAHKVYDFMFYQAMRTKRKRGGKSGKRLEFNLEDYEMVKAKYSAWLSNPLTPPEEPANPIGNSCFVQYQQAIRTLFCTHVADRMTGLSWEHVWTLPLRNLHTLVKNRRNRVGKQKYQEKLNHEFAPYQAVEDYPLIEQALWNRGQTCNRSAFSWMRHRFCLLYSTSGILRCESLFQGELSDYIGLEFQKPQDPHSLELLVTQIATGKTNHGTQLYGRSMRHKLVELCSYGAFCFYLAFRFFLTHEFDKFTVDDWCDNRKWFDIKLLVDASRSDADYTKCMDNATYASAIKRVLGELGIPSCHWVHLGRTIGPKILELLEEEAEAIRVLGNWDPKIQETSYSTKLPLGPMRKIAGWIAAQGMYYNPRSQEWPSIPLMKKTPYGFSFDAYAGVMAAITNHGDGSYTALCFLKLMMNCAKVFLQDAAAMIIKFPERASHPMYSMDCFQGEDWMVSVFLYFVFVPLCSIYDDDC
jgi:hypothetical protein